MKIHKNKGNKPTKDGFGEGVLEAARKNDNVVGIGADITASVGMNHFADQYPDRFVSLGIAEQNCVGVAAGLALSGKIPVFSTYAVFAALRTTDQVRISICYNNVHVIIGGAHAGISVGPDGATHQALEDIAIMRVLPNMTVISPCDATQAKTLTQMATLEINGPVYIRFGREAVPDFSGEKQALKIGGAQRLINGKDISILATGHMVWEALEAARLLSQNGIEASVINFHTIKPIDEETIVASSMETGAIVTAEEHQVFAGFGSAVAEVVARHVPVPIEFVGMPDTFGESGKPEELMKKYGLKAKNIVDAALRVLKRKRK